MASISEAACSAELEFPQEIKKSEFFFLMGK
jgi:hypothetical protein